MSKLVYYYLKYCIGATNSQYAFQANENLGMVMVFTLVSAGQEWLNVRWEEMRNERDESLLRKQEEEEEAERVN